MKKDVNRSYCDFFIVESTWGLSLFALQRTGVYFPSRNFSCHAHCLGWIGVH